MKIAIKYICAADRRERKLLPSYRAAAPASQLRLRRLDLAAMACKFSLEKGGIGLRGKWQWDDHGFLKVQEECGNG
ncbi:hypothetical protein SLA2020_397060 [Shorea laevis]